MADNVSVGKKIYGREYTFQPGERKISTVSRRERRITVGKQALLLEERKITFGGE